MAVTENELENHWVWKLTELGLTVIPLGMVGEMPPGYFIERCESVDEAKQKWPKTPRIKWKEYQTRKPSDAEVEGWLRRYGMTNFGIATGREIDVVDADGPEAEAFVRENLTHTPWVVRTAKGAHFIYRSDQQRPIKNSADEEAKLDTRGFGGYVVAPGSTHPSGAIYELQVDEGVKADSINDLPQLSNRDIGLIADFKAKSRSQQGGGLLSGFNAEDHVVIERGSQEGGRNNHMARMVGKWIAEGFSAQDVLTKALAINEQNSPPLAHTEVLSVVNSVTNTHLLNHMQEASQATPKPDAQPSSLLISPDQLTISPPKWLIKGLLPKEGIGVLFGPSGGGKSFVALDMCLSIAAGRDWHGHKVRQGSVVYVCGEGLSGVANRIKAWEKHTGISINDLPIRITAHPVRFLDRASIKELGEAIEAQIDTLGGQIDCICVDTLNRNFGDGDENSTKDMTRFVDAMTDIQKFYECVLPIVHHTGHADGERARGSSALRASLDFEIQLKVTSAPGDIEKSFSLLGKKMKDGKELPEIGFRLIDVELGVDEDGETFGSCVIEQCMVLDAKAIANSLVGRPGPKKSKGMLALNFILIGYINRADSNGHDGRVIVDRNELISDFKNQLGPTGKNSNRYIAQGIEKGWLIDLGSAFEVTEAVKNDR